MTKEEVIKAINRKIDEIRDIYYSNYENANYLTIAIFKDVMWVNNSYSDEDKSYPINDARIIEGEENGD